MNELYETLKSIMTEVTSSRAHIETVKITLSATGQLLVRADWSDEFVTIVELTAAQAREADAEFFVKSRFRNQRRSNDA